MEPVVLLERTAEPAFASDESGRIVVWNPAAESLLGHEAADVIGRSCWEVIQGLDLFGNWYCAERCNPRRMLEHHGPVRGFELDVRTASGELVRAAFSLFVVRGGSPGGYTVVHLMRPVAVRRRDAQSSGGDQASGQADEPSAASSTAGKEAAYLSRREIEVLQLVSEGVTTRQLGQHLSVSTSTVRTHVQNILRKLGAHSKLEAVAWRWRSGLGIREVQHPLARACRLPTKLKSGAALPGHDRGHTPGARFCNPMEVFEAKTLPAASPAVGPARPQPGALGPRRLTLDPPPRYPSAMVNVTNRCNLSCQHCFVFREGNPNELDGEMTPERVLSELERLRDRHGIRSMLWMGGEPMLRWRMIEKGVALFERNTITTNGTIPLKDFGPDLIYVISLDGPREVNDPVRGEGVFDRVMRTVAAVPDGFRPTVMVQCVLHRENQRHLDELVRELLPTRVQGLTFSFYVPRAGEVSSQAWETLEEREAAVDIVLDLKRRHPSFIWNSTRSLDLMRPATAKRVTDYCPMQQIMLPLYIEGDHFTTPFCCYGNDVDCDRCGSWGVFSMAAKMPGPWDAAAV